MNLRGKHFQAPSYVNVSSAKITLALAIQVIYELSLANDFHTGLYNVSSLLSLHTVKNKIHRITVLENIVVIKSVVSSCASAKTFHHSLKSAQLTCRREHGVLIYCHPQLDNGHLFSGTAFQELQTDRVFNVVTAALAQLETNTGCWLINNGNKIRTNAQGDLYFSMKMVL